MSYAQPGVVPPSVPLGYGQPQQPQQGAPYYYNGYAQQPVPPQPQNPNYYAGAAPAYGAPAYGAPAYTPTTYPAPYGGVYGGSTGHPAINALTPALVGIVSANTIPYRESKRLYKMEKRHMRQVLPPAQFREWRRQKKAQFAVENAARRENYRRDHSRRGRSRGRSCSSSSSDSD